MDDLDIKYRLQGKALPPRPIRMKVPGWGGDGAKKMVDGSDPQPWHCRPWVDAANYGLELLYPYETECHVLNVDGVIKVEWNWQQEPGGGLTGAEFGIFDTVPHQYYLFESGVDLQAPAGFVLQTQPHPRFFTDQTGTVPPALIGHVQSEWWPRQQFVVFKMPPRGQRHIFRKGDPYVQILFVPKGQEYTASPMDEALAARRRELADSIQATTSYIADNVWHNPDGSEFKSHYKVLARAYSRDGQTGVDKAVSEAVERRREAVPAGNSAAEYVQLANQYRDEGKHLEARDLYMSVLRTEPRNPDAAYGLATLAAATGMPQFAFRMFQQSAAARPEAPDAHIQMGLLLQRYGRIPEAEACFRNALRASPQDVTAMCHLAITLGQQGRIPEAMAMCQTALALAPQSAQPLSVFGQILASQRRFGEARACFQAAMTLDPSNTELRRMLDALPS